MRTEQILLALNISRERSIKEAANDLFISQANASIMLKTLEKELGYSLFERTSNGMLLTEKGSEFIRYAGQIEQSLQAISHITEPQKQISLRIVAIKYGFSELAFGKLCQKYCSEGHSAKLSYKTTCNTKEAQKQLETGEVDLSVAICRKGQYDSVLYHAEKLNIEIVQIGETHLEVTCRKGHPIIKNKRIAYDLFGKYPAIISYTASSLNLYAPFFLSRQTLDIHNLITIEPCPTRYQLLKDMNAYLVSMPLPTDVKEEYGFESLKIKDSEISIFAAFHKNVRKDALIQEFIQYCKEFV